MIYGGVYDGGAANQAVVYAGVQDGSDGTVDQRQQEGSGGSPSLEGICQIFNPLILRPLSFRIITR